ncbi:MULTISPECIES: hypothetical protein [Pseudomonas syringae group]|uniref:Uncharacterized protein n=2 Tax=Pseudomonas syringae group TaxID=136849 RepID=A0A1S6YB55_PSESY|nr:MULTISPECIES: hypothetical protein [Pseudomonas syringae group]ALE01126.1 hypothetical protein PSYRMG_25995 [Pseudomonas syringae UMAF0158]AQX42065.1 hypothetical protein [Pseudomonas syringae pv. syringae]MCK9734902.1 hypothetical protein [Pseudomonas syringae pv. syringae]RMV74690.1 hypothetical protein ALP05_200209 [Pseudomonas caricapapayae]
MDELLNSSDGLHTEILVVLQDAKAFPVIRHEVALVACGMALEHALSLRLLVRAHYLQKNQNGNVLTQNADQVLVGIITQSDLIKTRYPALNN